MQKEIKFIAGIVLTVLLSLSMMSCVYDSWSNQEIESEITDDTYIVIHVSPVSPIDTRAENKALEEVQNLRIIMMSRDEDSQFKVELNQKFYTTVTPDKPFEYIIKTKKTDKKFYLFANEDNKTIYNNKTEPQLTTVLDNVAEGDTEFGNLIESSYYEVSEANIQPLLYTSYYEIGADELANKGQLIEKEFYLIHTATKFDISFVNFLGADIEINELSLSNTASGMYLLANFDKERSKTFNVNGDYWIDWLKMVSEDTQPNPGLPGNTEINEKYGWIKNYNLPDGINHSPFTIPLGDHTIISADNNNKPFQIPTFYASESKNIDDDSGEQVYTLNLRLSVNGEEKTFSKKIDTVQALFRNTHVDIVVVIRGNFEIELLVGICPWVYKTIDIPTFD